MRKYTSKKQKTKMYAEKYNMEEEEVNRILSEYEDLLTLDELKIRYDNPNIGILPDLENSTYFLESFTSN